MEMSFITFFSSYRKLCYGVKNVPAVFIDNLRCNRKKYRINGGMCQEMAANVTQTEGVMFRNADTKYLTPN